MGLLGLIGGGLKDAIMGGFGKKKQDDDGAGDPYGTGSMRKAQDAAFIAGNTPGMEYGNPGITSRRPAQGLAVPTAMNGPFDPNAAPGQPGSANSQGTVAPTGPGQNLMDVWKHIWGSHAQ